MIESHSVRVMVNWGAGGWAVSYIFIGWYESMYYKPKLQSIPKNQPICKSKKEAVCLALNMFNLYIKYKTFETDYQKAIKKHEKYSEINTIFKPRVFKD